MLRIIQTINVLLILYQLFLIVKNKEYKDRENRENFFITILGLFIASVFVYENTMRPNVLALILLIIKMIDQKKNLNAFKYILPGFYSYLIVSYKIVTHNSISVVLTLLFLIILYITITYITNEKIGAAFVAVFSFAMRLGQLIIGNYRFGGVTLHDIMSIPTAMTIASTYRIKFGFTTYLLLFTTILFSLIYLVFAKTEKRELKNKLKKIGILLLAFIISIWSVGTYTQYVEEKDYIVSISPIESFLSSVVEEIKLSCKIINSDKAKAEIEKFEDDEKEDFQPNIIGVLCESYADIPKLLNINTSRDSMKAFYELEDSNCKLGTIKVDTFGGGTSKSEWEFLTGLDVSKYSKSQIPFLGKCKYNYTFTNNDLYKDYKLSVFHPFGITGWNRKSVYETFEYDNLIFREYGGMQDAEYIHGYVSDAYVYDQLKKMIEENEEPQFINTITIQNHGNYTGINLENEIKITEDIENKEMTEGVLTLMEISSEEIAKFVKYLDEHKEEPTLLIFYGDHYAGGLFEDRSEEAFITPYMVYSNFCDLGDMPEHLDLSLLYPYAKAAAGLPMTAYEKYLQSLNGNTVDLNMILSKMKGKIK